MAINHDVVDINQVSIDHCFNCPYPDECVATDTELCSYLKTIANRERAKYEKEKREKENEILRRIESLISDNCNTMHGLARAAGVDYSLVQALMRRGRIEVKREKKGKKTIVIVLGVNIAIK